MRSLDTMTLFWEKIVWRRSLRYTCMFSVYACMFVGIIQSSLWNTNCDFGWFACSKLPHNYSGEESGIGQTPEHGGVIGYLVFPVFCIHVHYITYPRPKYPQDKRYPHMYPLGNFVSRCGTDKIQQTKKLAMQ